MLITVQSVLATDCETFSSHSMSEKVQGEKMINFACLTFLIQAAIFFITPIAGKQECYGQLGCFSDDPPFDDVYFALPQSPAEIGTKFRLFTRRTNSSKGEILYPNATFSSINTTFIPSAKVTMIVHGFTQNGLVDWVQQMRVALLIKKSMNVIVVDWEQGASLYSGYNIAAGNTRLVGVQVAQMIHFLHRRFRVKMSNFHVIGHSLGAQIAGFAGAALLRRSKRKLIGRITGLDPARPGFDVENTEVRLDPSDAKFVDVIHTDAGGILGLESSASGGLGLYRPCGHVDFYPNGGKMQPGCRGFLGDFIDQTLRKQEPSLQTIAACNHMKAVYYFTASITCPMQAYVCNSWEEFQHGKCFECRGACQHMGYNADQYFLGNKTLKAFLKTKEQKPYCVAGTYYSLKIATSPVKQGFFGSFLKMMPMSSIVDKILGITVAGDQGEEAFGERTIASGSQTFLVTSTQSLGKITSAKVEYNYGPALHLDKVTILSSDNGAAYTACFDTEMPYSLFKSSSTYEQKTVKGIQDC